MKDFGPGKHLWSQSSDPYHPYDRELHAVFSARSWDALENQSALAITGTSFDQHITSHQS